MSHRSSSRFCWAALVPLAATLVVAGAAEASPARRLARRGVVVVPPPDAIVLPPAPVVLSPRQWRRLGPPAVVVLPGGPAAVGGAEPVLSPSPGRISSSLAAVPTVPVTPKFPAIAPPTPPAAGPKPAAAAPATGGIEEIPAPLPAQSGEAAAGAASIAFTPAWYARHPDAWRPAGPPPDWWRVADPARVTDWLGQQVVRAGGEADPGRVATTAGEQPDADGLRSVLVLQAGHGPEAGGSDWLPLGVFAVVPPGGGSAHNFQQLAVDRSGAIRGNFYDAVSDTVLPITGSIDRGTLRAAWTVGANGSRFEAAVAAFAAPPRNVTVTTGGASRGLELAPIDGP